MNFWFCDFSRSLDFANFHFSLVALLEKWFLRDSWIREFVFLSKFAKIKTSRVLPDPQYTELGTLCHNQLSGRLTYVYIGWHGYFTSVHTSQSIAWTQHKGRDSQYRWPRSEIWSLWLVEMAISTNHKPQIRFNRFKIACSEMTECVILVIIISSNWFQGPDYEWRNVRYLWSHLPCPLFLYRILQELLIRCSVLYNLIVLGVDFPCAIIVCFTYIE